MAGSASMGQVQDIVRVETAEVSCDGRSPDDQLGHPLVYLAMEKEGRVTCPYCSRQFILVETFDNKG